MLGGPVYIAFIRFVISLTGTILLYSLISDPRFDRKKTLQSYICFSAAVIAAACTWYVFHWESCVRAVAFVMYIFFSFFAIYMSRGPLLLTLYKLALTFYLLAVFLIGGIEISIIFFNRNVWADIISRILLISIMAIFMHKYVKNSIRDFSSYVEHDLDRFSAVVIIISILSGISFILKPTIGEQTPYHLFQIIMNFFLTGSLQLLVYRLYLHIGKEQAYQEENQLMQMNHRLLERNMELMEEAIESGRRIRHDVRHHNAVIVEYARRGQMSELLQYLNEYDHETDTHIPETICANIAVNNILSAYTKRARKEQIHVTLDVKLCKTPAIPSIDLVTILANAYENAIFGCVEVKKQSDDRMCFIHLMIKTKQNKLVICCKNTCRMETTLRDGQPKPEFTGGIGVSSIIRTAENYNGEYDFRNDNGVFIFRLIMSLPPLNTPDEKEEV